MINIKRVFDLLLSILGSLSLAPLFIIIAVLIKLEDGGPVFFRQKRVGYKGKTFFIWKLRTMTASAEKCSGRLSVGRDPSITRIGRWLRKTKINELPQLINVLLGEMSLVGPRPELLRYVALYNAEQRKVLDLKPGITDPASLRYRNESELLAGSADPEKTYIQEIMPKKIRMSLEYASKATILSDMWVIIRTFWSLIKNE
jgi:lipopolysaccharide/colanic/teichoic acid biosynthesis glycosyltransferase